MQALAAAGGGYKQQARQRTGRGERDRKKKMLQERRKPLNIDHLAADKLQEKLQELYDSLIKIETERYVGSWGSAMRFVKIVLTNIFVKIIKIVRKFILIW